MKLEETATITHPPRQVFFTLRDRIEELVSFAEHIEHVEVLERQDRSPITYLHNRWQGVKESVPAIFRPFATRDMTAWLDHAEWDEHELCCRWRVEPIKHKEVFDTRGTTRLADDGQGGCLFTLQMEIQLHLERLQGVPRFIAKRINEPVARFVARTMRPNLLQIADAIQAYLDDRAAGGAPTKGDDR